MELHLPVPVLVLDGTLIDCGPSRGERSYYSAKHRCPGMNVSRHERVPA